MNNVTVIKNFKEIKDYGVVDGMLKLCEYGTPRLCSEANGEWYCAIEMFVEGKGVKFKVASEFNESSMENAVRCCLKRLQKALTDLGV